MVHYLGIALISAATLLLELALLRVFAVQQFYHFAFMAISLALLGAGASGSWLSVRRKPMSPLPLCLAFALSTAGAYLLINYLPFDSFSIAWDGKQVVYLALYFLAAAVPFIFAGLVVGSELMRAGDEGGAGSHSVYAANLLGSASGSLGSLPALAVFGGSGAVMLAATVAVLAALLFAWDIRCRSSSLAVSILLLLAFVAVLVLRPEFLSLRLSPYKTLSVLLQSIDARHVLSDWSTTARVDVVESGAIHVMPGLSLQSPVSLPPQTALLLDGDHLMPISHLSPAAPQAEELAAYMPHGIAHTLRPNAHTLILEAGTGIDVLLALASGARHVTAVEDNALLVETMRGHYGQATDHLYEDPRVTVETQSGRVFARRPHIQPFDLVVLSLTDPHRPVTSGAYSLTENYVYTIEAFRDYLRVLDDDGLLIVTRWLQTPPSECARTFGALAAALRASGHDPQTQLIAFRTMRTMTILAAKRPFDEAEIESVRHFLQTRNFDAVYYAGIRPNELNRFNVLPAPAYHELFVDILQQPAATYRDYRFDIRPPTDDRPFFFHYFKWRQTPEILATLGMTWQPFGGSGYFVLVSLLLLVALASALLIVGPLLLKRQHATVTSTPLPWWRLRVFSYFAALGLAFLFVEIPLAQRFILVLDEPVIALSVVVFTVLLFSGLGSLTVRRWPPAWGLSALVLLVLLYPLLLEPVANLILPLSDVARIGLTVVVLAPLGFLMGVPFAAGLAVVERHDSALVPWAWAINGSFSVVSSVLAIMVALSLGFSVVLWLGAAAYAAALLVFRPLW